MALEDGFWYRYLKQSRDKYNKGNYKALVPTLLVYQVAFKSKTLFGR